MVEAGTAKSWMETAAPGSLGATRRAIRYSGRCVLFFARRRKEAGADFAGQNDGCAHAAVTQGNMHFVVIDRGDPDLGVILLVVADFRIGRRHRGAVQDFGLDGHQATSAAGNKNPTFSRGTTTRIETAPDWTFTRKLPVGRVSTRMELSLDSCTRQELGGNIGGPFRNTRAVRQMAAVEAHEGSPRSGRCNRGSTCGTGGRAEASARPTVQILWRASGAADRKRAGCDLWRSGRQSRDLDLPSLRENRRNPSRIIGDLGVGHHVTCSAGALAPLPPIACGFGETSDGTKSAMLTGEPISLATPMTSAHRLVGIRFRLCHPCTVV